MRETSDPKKSQKTGCPYWDCQAGNSCLMTKAGLYIPMPIHVEIFCRTDQHTSCHHYIRGCQFLRETPWKDVSREDRSRRHFPRFSQQIQVALAECDNRGIPTDHHLDDSALTVDFSRGGLRIKSGKELPPNKLIAFTFGTGFGNSMFSGLGEVRWCRHNGEAEGFQAGLAFHDLQTSQAVCDHMGIPLV